MPLILSLEVEPQLLLLLLPSFLYSLHSNLCSFRAFFLSRVFFLSILLMDSDQGKLFIGGISWETSEDKLKDYFGRYGDVLQTVVMRDKVTGKPRGFGFVVFSDPDVLDRVLEDRHVIDGRTVEAKKALSREEQQGSKAVNPSSGRNFGSSGGNNRTKKIFVGGLPPSLSEDEFRQYFETYGTVTDVVIMFDQQTNRPRGFGFISFDTEDAVDSVMHKNYHDLSGKQVEVKRALPKDANPGGGSGRSSGGGGGGGSGGGGGGGGGGGSGGYQGYNSSGGGQSGSYHGLADSNRYMQSQNTGGGYPPYGGSAYNTAGYGYGSTNNSMGGYGGTNPGYGGPAGAGYGNPNLPGAGYGSGPQGAPRGSWNPQIASGYGNMGYGNAPWSANASTGSGGNATGLSPSGAGGYGSQGYGYGGYGSSDGAYGNPAGYGAAGGTPNGNSGGGANAAGDVQGGGGYTGGGYGDASGNWGYGNYGAGPHGGQGGYAGGYGGAPTRQTPQ